MTEAGQIPMGRRIQVEVVPIKLPYELQLAMARLAERDVCQGAMVTGFELDWYEEIEREVMRAEADLLVYGEKAPCATSLLPRQV